jgi:hypothetical protein
LTFEANSELTLSSNHIEIDFINDARRWAV